MGLALWIFGVDAILAIVLALMVFTGWATDDQRCYRKMQK